MSILAAAVLLIAQCVFFHLTQAIDSHAPDCRKNISTAITCSNWNNNFTDNSKIVFENCTSGERVFTSQHTITMVSLNNICISGDKASVIEHTSIAFTNVNNLHLENLVIRNCSSGPSLAGGIQIINCTNVSVKNIIVENSIGTGLTLMNTSGMVTIENSTFRNNSHHKQEGSNGWKKKLKLYDKIENEGGGGLKMFIGDVNNSTVEIKDCKFLNNNALIGGGLLVVIRRRASGNTVNIQSSTFTSNKCPEGFGGGMLVGYITEDESEGNNITIQDCIFSRNDATFYGGGTAIIASQSSKELFTQESQLEFNNCSWTSNVADRGMAVDIAKTFVRDGLLLSLVFTSCKFSLHKKRDSIDIDRKPQSVFSVTGYKLKFSGKTYFRENYATAIEATSTELDFDANAEVEFTQNYGVYGGAMRLNDLTVMYVQDNSTFRFESNSAAIGGALFVGSHFLTLSQSCFIQYKGDKSKSPNNVYFNFTNNTSSYSKCTRRENTTTNTTNCQNSIYATTLAPCFEGCLDSNCTSLNEVLKHLGDFTFDQGKQLSTAPHHFSLSDIENKNDAMCQLFLSNSNNTIHVNKNLTKEDSKMLELHFVPGRIEKLPLKLVDDLCEVAFFQVSVQSLNSTIILDPIYSIIINNSMRLLGEVNATGILQLSAMNAPSVIKIKVTLDECPPGYVLDDQKACKCSSSSDQSRYTGIERCNEKKFQAQLKHGYWIGYKDNTRRSSSLTSAICPRGFCMNVTHWLWKDLAPRLGNNSTVLCPPGFCNFEQNKSAPSLEHSLPSNSSEDLSLYICNLNRKGTICGECKAKHSAFYRSKSFSCKPDDLCYLGWLFYILTELLPVTILFLVVIFFNISFTSGPLNGMIFFMQVVDTLKLNAENFIRVDPQLYGFDCVHKLAYRIFTLRMFAIEEFSFCLWKGANALDMLAFRYVTIIYSLFLVVATIFLLKVCSVCRQKAVLNLRHSVIHGLSAFLIMSYSECTRVSFMILTYETLTIGPESKQEGLEYVAFYNGNYSYMGLDHLRYALPAILFLITMVIIPPLLLLGYPLCYKLFALLRIEESNLVQITCKIFPLEKIKPFFDSIQGAFNDHYRFFAGLYLMYRLCLLLTFTYTSTLTSFYTFTGVQLLGMLLVHSVCRPYKKTWYNILDALLLTNLAVINALTFYNYQLLTSAMNDDTVNAVGGVQAALVLLPLVYLIIYTTYHIVKRIKVACVHKSITHKESDNTDEVIDTLDARNLEDSLVEMNNYILLGPKPKAN